MLQTRTTGSHSSGAVHRRSESAPAGGENGAGRNRAPAGCRPGQLVRQTGSQGVPVQPGPGGSVLRSSGFPPRREERAVPPTWTLPSSRTESVCAVTASGVGMKPRFTSTAARPPPAPAVSPSLPRAPRCTPSLAVLRRGVVVVPGGRTRRPSSLRSSPLPGRGLPGRGSRRQCSHVGRAPLLQPVELPESQAYTHERDEAEADEQQQTGTG